MGAHSAKDDGRAAKLAGRGLLSAAAALALIGGGSGTALAGEASHGSSHDSDHHDKGDKHDRDKGDKHEKKSKKDRKDRKDCKVEEGPLTAIPGLGTVLDPPKVVCEGDEKPADEDDRDMDDEDMDDMSGTTPPTGGGTPPAAGGGLV